MKTNLSAASPSKQNYSRDSSRVREVDEEEPGNRTRRKRDESLNGSSSLEEPSPSKVYRMKTNQSATSTSRQNYLRDSSRVRDVDEEEPGNRTRTRRKRDKSLNGSSSLKEPSPSKVYRMKTNQSATSTSRQNYLRDSSRVREVDEEEPGNRTRTRRKRDESLNGSSSLKEPSPSKVYRMKTIQSAASPSRQNYSRDSSRVREVDEEEPGNRTRTRRKRDESLNGSSSLEEPSPSKVYRIKTNQSATSTSRQYYLRDSSRVRDVDEEEPGNRTRTRRKMDESLNGSSSLEEPSPSKVYRIKTNLSNAASTSRKHNSRDSSRMRRADEEEPRTRTRRNGDESLNRTRGSVFVPETCPDSGEEEMPGVEDVTVPETQPVPGDVSGDNVESDSEPVRPRQSNRSRKIVESESDYARSNRSGRVTAENTDTASSTRESRKSTSSQRRSSGRRRDGKDATEMEVDEVSYMDSKPRNVQENIANQLGGVVNNGSRRTDKMSSPPIKEIAELIETPSKVRKERFSKKST
ncbi:peptidyl-prolyl cis-trans isomerase 8-like [Lineus longissimus]|uniref:peptidyl-prolyl cis-trans isomerase 8-like n=1 Tax=Lineus longissimus TaxID=88925 RepID=UPI00315CD806